MNVFTACPEHRNCVIQLIDENGDSEVIHHTANNEIYLVSPIRVRNRRWFTFWRRRGYVFTR